MKEGWQIKKLGEVCDIYAGQGAPQGDENYCSQGTPFIKAGNLEALTSGELESNVQQVSEDVAKSHKLVKYKKGSVVFAKSGMSCMKGYIYTLQGDCYVVSHLAILTPKQIESSYLNYCLKIYKPCSLAKEAAFPSITLKELSSFEIPVPPLSEQQRIVSLLDAEFAKIDALKTNAERNLQNAKDLFQAALKKELEPKKGWKTTILQDICTNIVDCPHSTPIKSTTPTDYPCIRTSELRNGEIYWETMQYVDESEYRKRVSRLIPQENDIVYGREGTFGDAVLLPKCFHFCLGQRTMLFRPNQELVIPRFLLLYVISPYVFEQAKAKNTGCGVAHVNVRDIKEFNINLPPTHIQQSIVAHLDSLNEKCKTLQANYEKTIALCDDLKQALLRQAFNGEI